MNPRSSLNAIGNARVFRVIGYALVFLMMTCVVMTLGILIRHVAPDGHSGIIAGILLFILIDRLYTYRQLKSLALFSSEWFIALGAQWILILLVSRFLLSYADGLDSFRADLSRWARGSIVDLFTPELVFTLLLAMLVWDATGRFLDLLDEIGLDQERALREDSVRQDTEAVPAHQRLVNLIFSLGILLVVLTALTRINIQPILSNTEGLPPVQVSRFSGAEAGAVLYFVFGLALSSLSRLMGLQTHWNHLRIPISSANLARQWGLYSLLFLLLLAVVVSLLPAGDSFGLLSVIATLFNFLAGVFFFLAQLILTLFMLLLSLPLSLLRGAPPAGNFPSAPLLPNLPAPPPSNPADNAVWGLIRSILLWGSLLALVFFSLRQFIRQHGGLASALRRSRLANWLILAWQWLSRTADTSRLSLSRAIAEGWQSLVSRLEGSRLLSPAALIRLRSLGPRQRIYFFYLALVRRGAEQGLPRKPSQTPSEYAVTLEKALPSAGEDIDSMTKAFIEARYSRKEVEPKKAELVREIWGRIRRELQEKSRNGQSENH